MTHTQNLCSAFNPSKVHHTAVNTHTVNTHTVNTHTYPEQWAAIYAAAPGEQLGHLSRGIEGVESAGYSLPHLQFLPARDSNSQPFDYESDSLTIRPRIPFIIFFIINCILNFFLTTMHVTASFLLLIVKYQQFLSENCFYTNFFFVQLL